MSAISLFLLATTLAGPPEGDAPTVEQVRETIRRSIPYIEEKGAWWIREKNCVSCHRVGTMVWSLRAARQRGFSVSDRLDDWLDWAIDHSESPADIDGSSHTAILAIRDLAGGYQIAWLPVIDQTATETVSVLRSIFDLYGAPLVIKSDNGSAFKSELFANLLEAWDCQHLRSPARTLRYNGSCEAEIGAMKVRTRHYAERRGAAHEWTCDDLNAARRQANHIHRSETDPYRAAAERWSERETIIPAQRTTLANLIQEHGNVLMTRSTEKNNCTRSRAIERQALSQALVSMGLLSVSWRRIHPPLNPSRLANIS